MEEAGVSAAAGVILGKGFGRNVVGDCAGPRTIGGAGWAGVVGAVGAAGAGVSGWGKPKKRLGISSETDTRDCFWADNFLCAAKNAGATTCNGKSSSKSSTVDAEESGFMYVRRSRQARVKRPRFNPGSTALKGRGTLALPNPWEMISAFISFGHFSANSWSQTEKLGWTSASGLGADLRVGVTGVTGAIEIGAGGD